MTDDELEEMDGYIRDIRHCTYIIGTACVLMGCMVVGWVVLKILGS